MGQEAVFENNIRVVSLLCVCEQSSLLNKYLGTTYGSGSFHLKYSSVCKFNDNFRFLFFHQMRGNKYVKCLQSLIECVV